MSAAQESGDNLSPKALQELIDPRFRADLIPIRRLFLLRYGTFPCIMTYSNATANAVLHVATMLRYLAEKYEHTSANDIVKSRYKKTIRDYIVTDRLCDLGNGIMIYFGSTAVKSDVINPNQYPSDYSDDYFVTCKMIKICYLVRLDSIVKELGNALTSMTLIESACSKLNLIYRVQSHSYRLHPIQIKNPTMHDLALHYGQEFVGVHEKILSALSKENGKGLVLLHGLPGTGKTHYIRYLIEKINEKKLIYLPPDMAKELSKPTFLAFLLQYPNSILIIEDAENIIRDRSSAIFNPTQAVANLLNLSDGLLNDALAIQIVATFNCDLTTVDSALLRPGRLIANHAFDKLDVSTAKRLSEKLGYGVEHITEPMTLADIYNANPQSEIDIVQ